MHPASRLARCLFLLPLLSLGAEAATYFLSPTGNDANAGTIDKPWRTLDRLQTAQTTLRPGDTVFFRGGEYVITDANRSYYSFRAAGTPENRIVYRNYANERPVIIYDRTTADNETGSATMVFMSGNYSSYEGLTFRQSEASRLQGMNGTTIVRGRTKTALATWSTGVVVRNCVIENFAGLGIYFHGQDLLVERCTVTGTGSHAFYISGKNGTYRYNTTDGSRGYPNQQGIQIQYSTSIGNKIYGNLMKNGRASGVVFSGAVSNNDVHDNVIINGGAGAAWGSAVSFWCEDGAIGPGNAFRNNTVIGKSSSALISNGTCPNATKDPQPFMGRVVEIRNNIFQPTPAVRVGLSLPNVRDNIFFGVVGAVPANNVLANPLLVNAAGSNAADAMLRPGSPAIDSGKGSSPATDFAGVPRPSAFDVGAFEFRPPVAPPDVVISSLSFASGSVSVTLRNQGSGPTPLPVPVSLSLDGALRLSASSSGVLAPGASSTLSASLAIAPGVHSLVATANSPKAFDESSLSNNSKTISVGDVALAGHWQLDETSGPSALDVSGNSNHAAFLNSPSSAQGKFSNALDFSGATAAPASNDRLLIPDSNTLDFGTASFSYGLWVNAASTSGNYDMPWWKGGSSPGVPGYDFELGAGRWAACLSDGDEGLCAAFSSSPLLGRWVHLFAVVDRRAASLSLFVDGRLVSSSPIPSSFGSTSSSFPASIGASSSGPYPFKGRIDDVRVYSRALSPSEVAQLLMAPSAPRPPASLSVQ